MIFPLDLNLSASIELGLAAVLGLGFGICLERAGFGSARRLTAVFYFYDMAVVKVMFTAIVTAMVVLGLASALGWLEMSELYLEPSYLPAQLVGGLVFGLGFIVGGYCPGTSVAALASGRIDALSFAAGMLVGVWTYAEWTPGLEVWSRLKASEQTLPEATGVAAPYWWLVFLAALALAAWGMARLEARFATLRPNPSGSTLAPLDALEANPPRRN